MAVSGSVENAGRDRRRFVISMVAVLIVSLAVRLLLLNHFRWENNYDSGLHGLLAQLLAAGYAPYTDVFVSYPPLFIWSLQLPWWVWGNVDALQIVMVFYSLLGVLAVGFVAYRLNGWLAGLLAAGFLSLAGSYLSGSSQVMTEVPAISLATAAVALSFAYYTGQRRRLLIFASGLAMSASLMLKILTPYVLILMPLLVLMPELETEKPLRTIVTNFATNLLLLGAGVILPVLATLLLYNPGAMYSQVISFRLDSRAAYLDEWMQNQQVVARFLFVDNLPLALSTMLGIVIVRKKRWKQARFIWLWLLLSILFATVHVPLRQKHLPLILPPLAILAGAGLAEGWYRARTLRRSSSPLPARALTVVVAALTLFYAGTLGNQFAAYAGYVEPALRYQTETVVDRLQQFTSPSDCMVTDYPSLAFFARRLVPPNLSEVSSTRLQSGYLGSSDLIQATEASGCQVVASVAGRLPGNTPDFLDWASAHFLVAWSYNESELDREVFLAQPLAEASPAHPTDATFGDRLKLVGYDARPAPRGEDRGLYVSLYWQALQPISENYTITLRFNGTTDDISTDHQPYGGLVPTHLFPTGKIVKDTVRVGDPPRGKSAISCGLFSTDETGSLSYLAGPAGADAVEIGSIEIR